MSKGHVAITSLIYQFYITKSKNIGFVSMSKEKDNCGVLFVTNALGS